VDEYETTDDEAIELKSLGKGLEEMFVPTMLVKIVVLNERSGCEPVWRALNVVPRRVRDEGEVLPWSE